MIGLDELCDVLTEDPSTGAFTVVAKSGLACHFYHVGRSAAATSQDRAELAAMRHLQFEYAYSLAEHDTCQIQDAAGLRWNPVTGSFKASTFGLSFRACDLVRAS